MTHYRTLVKTTITRSLIIEFKKSSKKSPLLNGEISMDAQKGKIHNGIRKRLPVSLFSVRHAEAFWQQTVTARHVKSHNKQNTTEINLILSPQSLHNTTKTQSTTFLGEQQRTSQQYPVYNTISKAQMHWKITTFLEPHKLSVWPARMPNIMHCVTS
jgi:hypothetical protein